MKLRGRARYEPLPDGVIIEQGMGIVVPRLDALGHRIDANARGRVPVRTGELSRSIGHRTFRRGSQAILREQATAPHARYVEFGTQPHEIRARNAQALRFHSRRLGRVVYAKRVWHPGYAGSKFLTNAVHEELARSPRI